MDIRTNISLKNYTTMKLGGAARFMAVATSADEIATLCSHASEKGLRVVILGGGSNTIVHDEGFDGLVILNRIEGIAVLESDESSVTIEAGGGVVWDDLVAFSVEKNLSGIEALSNIPGTVGAAPVQNIGAYGQEMSETFVSLTAYDMKYNQHVVLNAEECQFSYRDSIFRGEAAGRYAITAVKFRLQKSPPGPPYYKAVQDYFDQHNITLVSPAEIRKAVQAIRTEKLPDPKEKPNSGSFFKNTVLEKWQLDDLLKSYPAMPHFDMGTDAFKVPTGWLIEQTGLKGNLLHGIRVHDKNALVLINESATSYADLAAARDEIMGKVRDEFRIYLSQEPLEI